MSEFPPGQTFSIISKSLSSKVGISSRTWLVGGKPLPEPNSRECFPRLLALPASCIFARMRLPRRPSAGSCCRNRRS